MPQNTIKRTRYKLAPTFANSRHSLAPEPSWEPSWLSHGLLLLTD